MNYESIAKPKQTNYKPQESDLQKFIYSDCINKECIEGLIFKEIDGFSTIFKCCKCYRNDMKLRRWNDAPELRTEEEMEQRLQYRKDLVSDRDRRYKEAAELMRMLHDICKPKPKPPEHVLEIPDLAPGNMTGEQLRESLKAHKVDSI